ncbi:NERD domain-containing protein [Bacillus sp. B15-48]|uniref:NERD domain-containing protein n=1 Tax=Bacillus sp. B15-48 TaxID=1548601 RepID=UPI00193ED54C|nr:NERD domain-containing protein [Bacillus sp. B15-48]
MILLPRSIPLIVPFNHALIQRLPQSHPKLPIIEKDIRTFMAGYRGEVNTDYHLEFLNDNHHYVFQGIRLPHGTNFFQIDHLLICSKYILQIETKNHRGELTISEEQFSQTSNNSEKGYTNPYHQTMQHKDQLYDWLEAHGLPKLPIISLAVLSHPSAIIKSTDSTILQHLCKVDNLKNKILTHTNHLSERICSEKELKRISNFLLKDHTPHFPDLQTTYGILPSELVHKVRCPNCTCFQMARKDRVWVCPHCFYHSKTAYHDALLDYFLLIKPTITNREFRDFFGIDNIKTATYLLSSQDLPSTGIKKGRVYLRPIDFLAQIEERYLRQTSKQ